MKRAKKRFRRKLRKLRGQWTVEPTIELEALHGLELENELTKLITDEITRTRND